MRRSLTHIFLAAAALIGVQAITSLPTFSEESDKEACVAPKYTPAAASQMMADRGEQLVVYANRKMPVMPVVPGIKMPGMIGIDDEGKPIFPLKAQFYYLNNDQHIGHVISSDHSLKEPAHCVTIEEEVHNASLLDTNVPVLDPITQIAGDRAVAAQRCNRLQLEPQKDGEKSCSYHNDYLSDVRTRGYNVIFQGNIQHPSSDGARPDTRLTVIVNFDSQDKNGTETLSNTRDGAVIPSASLRDIKYTPKGAAIINSRIINNRSGP